MTICQHCGHGKVSRPRNLCWHCFYLPGVRDLYPIVRGTGRRGSCARLGATNPAPYPTSALPGSVDKILVLRQRAQAHQELWHPEDGLCVRAQVG